MNIITLTALAILCDYLVLVDGIIHWWPLKENYVFNNPAALLEVILFLFVGFVVGLVPSRRYRNLLFILFVVLTVLGVWGDIILNHVINRAFPILRAIIFAAFLLSSQTIGFTIGVKYFLRNMTKEQHYHR